MARIRKAVCLAFGVACFLWSGRAPADDNTVNKAQKKTDAPKFLRLKRDAKEQPTALETATVRYTTPGANGGVTVDLIGVVHVGEKAYYEKLNKQMEQYDVLLYELVAPEGTRVPKGGKRESDNPLSMLQGGMKTMLDLESQLEHIDYTKKNFVHADMSPEQMSEAMSKRGDNMVTVALSAFAEMMRKANLEEQKREKDRAQGVKDAPEMDLLGLLLDPNAGNKLKLMMAEQFDADGGTGLGATLNTLLVTDRNKACLKVLSKEMAKGKKKIGIFYGAAHMPDFETRLKDEYGLKRDKEEWLTAWDLKRKSAPKASPLAPLLKILGDK